MIEDIISPPWRRQLDKLLKSEALAVYRDLESDRLGRLVGPNPHDLYGAAALAEAVKHATLPTWQQLVLEAQSERVLSSLGTLADHGLDDLFEKLKIAEELTPDRQALLACATRIHEPWLDLRDAERSFDALGVMRELGHALASTDLFHSAVRDRIDEIVGHWAPEDPTAFASLSLEMRREALLDAGFDTRLTAVPAPAYPDALWVSGIGPRSRPQRTASAALAVVMPMTPADYAFAIIRRVERALRRFIEAMLRSQFGENWISTIVPKEMQERWDAVREGRGHAGRVLSLRDSELGDLLQLIVRKDLWRDVFKERSATHREEIQLSMSRLIAVRRPAAHSDDVGTEELMICAVEGRRLLRVFNLPIPWRIEQQIVLEADDADE